MAKNKEVDDLLYGALDLVGRGLAYLGGITVASSVGFLIYYFFKFASSGLVENPAQIAQLTQNFGNGLIVGSLMLAIGSALLFWGEEMLGPAFLVGAAALFFAPMYLPAMANLESVAKESSDAIARVQQGGVILFLFGLVFTIVDGVTKLKARSKQGAKADSLKYGKGAAAEKDYQNVLLGKCWQLPYCRKFVREKCPIYHSRRTCWKERVGCMCEEKVIQNAMQGGTIPKDSVAAAKFIPYNPMVPFEVKKERCRQCVIFNEHQRQKYKISVPVILLSVGGLYAAFREPLKTAVGGVANATDRLVGKAAMTNSAGLVKPEDQLGNSAFQEILALAVILILLAYLMRLAEYVFFKLKI